MPIALSSTEPGRIFPRYDFLLHGRGSLSSSISLDSLSPFVVSPSNSLAFTYTASPFDSLTYELYSDAALTHLVTTLTQSGFIINTTISGLSAATTYWLRLKITLSGVDSPWSNVLSSTTSA